MKIADLFENKENWDIKIEYGRDFVDRLGWDHEVFLRLKYIDPKYASNDDETIFYIEVDKFITAVGGLQPNPYNQDEIWMKYISTDPNFSNKGMAKSIFKSMVKYSEDKKFSIIKISSFTDDGMKWLKPFIKKLENTVEIEFRYAN